MRDDTASEKLKRIAGAVASLVTAGWAVVPAIAFLPVGCLRWDALGVLAWVGCLGYAALGQRPAKAS